MKNSKLKDTLRIILLLMVGINLTLGQITFIKYELSATEVDFTSSTDDQTVTLILTLDCDTRINFYERSFYRADGQLLFSDGKYYRPLEEDGEQTVTMDLTINAWGGDGEYKLKDVTIYAFSENPQKLDQEFIVTVKGTRKSTPPKILSYEASNTAITPEIFPITLSIESEAPLTSICSEIYNPDNQNIGGCSPITDSGFSITLALQFELEKCFKDGKYSFTYYAINKALVETERINFEVDVTSPDCSRQPQCIIQHIQTNIPFESVFKNGYIVLYFTVQSTSDLQYSSGYLISPTDQNLSDYAIQIQSDQYTKEHIKNDSKFEYKLDQLFQFEINMWSERGMYKYKDLRFQNEQLVWSTPQELYISIEYPNPPWVELIIDIKVNDNQWKKKLADVVDQFLSNRRANTGSVCLIERIHKQFSLLDLIKKQITLVIGNLQGYQQYESMKNNKDFSVFLNSKFVESVQFGSSEQHGMYSPSQDQQQDYQPNFSQISFIFSSAILITSFLF